MAISSLIIGLSGLGLLTSIYAYIIKRKLRANKDYRAACDFSERISCTKAMTSEYATIFWLPNSLYGVIFYALIFFLALLGAYVPIAIGSAFAVLFSLYLAYLSFMKLRLLCPLCTIVYVINLALLASSIAGL